MWYLVKRTYVLLLKKLEVGSAIGVRLTKYTGKSKEFIHPKHFINKKPWFTRYLNKSDTVVDLGCGNGQNSIKTARIVRKVIAIEVDEALLKIAVASSKRAQLKNITFQKANLEKKLSLKTGSVDKVIFLDVLEHINNRNKILNDIYRVLKKGGYLLIGVPNRDTSWKKLQRSVKVDSRSDPDHKIEFSKSSIEQLLEKHKFKIINFNYAPYDTPLRGLFDIIGGFSLSSYAATVKWRKSLVKRHPHEASGFEIVSIK